MNQAIGIDIGGTITKIGVISKVGDCLKKTHFRTKEHKSFSSYIAQLNDTLKDLIKKYKNIVGIGIGAPNASKSGTIETPSNLKWNGEINIIEKI